MLRRRLGETYISNLEVTAMVMAMIPRLIQSPQYQEQERETRIRIEASSVQFSLVHLVKRSHARISNKVC
jgi:hypothetical protein